MEADDRDFYLYLRDRRIPTPGLTGLIFRERLAIPTRPWFKSIQLKIFIMMDEFSQLIRCDWIYKEILS